MVYFKDLPYNPRTQAEHEQWLQVRKFRDDFPEGGLWRSYRTKPQLATQLRRDLTNLLKMRRHKSKSRARSAKPNAPSASSAREEPIPYTAEISFIPRSSSNTSHEFTLNVMLSNWSDIKLTDYDIELAFPGEFLSDRDSPVDRDVSTTDRAILRVPMPANTPPPPVYPGQTRNVLSLHYTITTNHLLEEAALLKRAELVVRFADGESLHVVSPIKDLHNSELFNQGLRRVGDESPRYEVGYQSVQKRRDLELISPRSRSKSLKMIF